MDLGALSDICTPWCIRVAATLRIADHLAVGTTDIADLAAATGCDPYSLHRLLGYLVSKGLFEEPSPGRFQMNEAARGLTDPSLRQSLDLNGLGGRMAGAWAGLLPAVRTGQAGYSEVFGRSFWDDLDARPDLAEDFDALMGLVGHGIPDPKVLIRGDWDEVRTVVDVGGGTGALLAQVLRAHPTVRGTLVDLPRTVARSADMFRAAGVADRVTTISQSFFDPLPGGADLYLLKNVLGDWPDREAVALLRRCADAVRPGGRLVVLGGVSPDTPTGPSPELLMLVLVGGRDRTLTQFRELAGPVGLQVTVAGRLSSGRFAVECRSA